MIFCSCSDKAPSAELAPDQTDEESLLPYQILDEIVKTFVEYFIDDYGYTFTWLSVVLISLASAVGFYFMSAKAQRSPALAID